MDRTNATRDRLLRDEPVFGAWVQSMSPRVAEVMAQTDLDWLGIDMEHTPVSVADVEEIVRAIDGSGVTPIVRLPSVQATISGGAKHVLDAGARGIIVPRIESPSDAEQAVEAALFPPAGDRGVAGSVRANGYGQAFDEYVAGANEATLVVVQLETRTAVEDADEILAVPHIDAVLIGENDLSATYGNPGAHDEPAVTEAVSRIVEAAHDNEVRPGVATRSPDRLTQRLDDGFRFFLLGGDLAYVRAGITDILAHRP